MAYLAAVTSTLENLTITPPAAATPSTSPPLVEEHCDLKKIKTIVNVHQDDIHAIVKLSDHTFITGSKDGSLKKWDFQGRLVNVVYDAGSIDYTKWVTAIAPLKEGSWMSGLRNGDVYLWDNAGTFQKELNLKHAPFPNTLPKCKDRNTHRVNCLASFEKQSGRPFFFAGWATQFTLHDHHTQKRLKYTYTSENDWVYVVHPLTSDSLLVVTGCRLDLWTLVPRSKDWRLDSKLIEEGPHQKPRPFISAITPLQEQETKFGAAVFDGSVRVYDLEARATIFTGKEHRNRVWTIENIAPHTFASCADDGTIKLWDIRQEPKSAFTVIDNPRIASRVSILLNLENNQLLSGSCPDKVKTSASKAQFSFWDIRRI